MTYTEKNNTVKTYPKAKNKPWWVTESAAAPFPKPAPAPLAYQPEAPPAVRYVKLRPFIRPQKTGIVPQLNVCGNWLEEAGFASGKYVSITVMKDMLVIRPAADAQL